MNKEKKASIQFLIFVAKPAKCLFHLHIDEFTGELSFQIALDAGTAACWLRTTKSGFLNQNQEMK
jgi:hypothetical protein